MKILHLSDLHINHLDHPRIFQVADLVEKTEPDVVAITGDISDNMAIDDFKIITAIKQECMHPCKYVFCLGNHEFANRAVSEVLNVYSIEQEKYDDIFCVDVCNFADIDNIRFVGNVLWYDGSLSDRPDKMGYLKQIVFSWLDSTIRNFNPVIENFNCVEQIKNALDNYSGTSVLLTHTVPHFQLNEYSRITPQGIYNIYSGMKNLFGDHDIYPDVALCGHTHKRATYAFKTPQNKSILCFNPGNDYHEYEPSLKFYVVEVDK